MFANIKPGLSAGILGDHPTDAFLSNDSPGSRRWIIGSSGNNLSTASFNDCRRLFPGSNPRMFFPPARLYSTPEVGEIRRGYDMRSSDVPASADVDERERLPSSIGRQDGGHWNVLQISAVDRHASCLFASCRNESEALDDDENRSHREMSQTLAEGYSENLRLTTRKTLLPTPYVNPGSLAMEIYSDNARNPVVSSVEIYSKCSRDQSDPHNSHRTRESEDGLMGLHQITTNIDDRGEMQRESDPSDSSRFIQSNSFDETVSHEFFKINCSNGTCSEDKYNCRICKLRCTNLEDFDSHMHSTSHSEQTKTIAKVYARKMRSRLKILKKKKKRMKNNESEDLSKSSASVEVDRRIWMRDNDRPDTSRHLSTNLSTNPGSDELFVEDVCCLNTRQQLRTSTHIRSSRRNHLRRSTSAAATARRRKPTCLTKVSQADSTDSLNQPSELTSLNPNEDIVASVAGSGSDLQMPTNHDALLFSLGQECVVSIYGFLCKLCNRFYSDEMAARVLHCRSKEHVDNYQNMLKMKLTLDKSLMDVRHDELAEDEIPTSSISSSSSSSSNTPDILKSTRQHSSTRKTKSDPSTMPTNAMTPSKLPRLNGRLME